MVELVEVLHVAEYDVLFTDDPWWNLLHTAGHLPKICLQKHTKRVLLSMFVHLKQFILHSCNQVKTDLDCPPSGQCSYRQLCKDTVLLTPLATG